MNRLDKTLQELIAEEGLNTKPGRLMKRKRSCSGSAGIRPKALYSKPEVLDKVLDKVLDDEPPASQDSKGIFEYAVCGFPDAYTPDQVRETLDLLRVNWLSLRRCFVLSFPNRDTANRFNELFDRGQVEIPAETFTMRQLAAESPSSPAKRSGIVELDVQASSAPEFETRGETRHDLVYVGFPENFTARNLREALEASEVPDDLLPNVKAGFAVSFRGRSLAMQFRARFHGQQVTAPLCSRFRLSVGC